MIQNLLAEIKQVQSTQTNGERTARVVLSFTVNGPEHEASLNRLIALQTQLVLIDPRSSHEKIDASSLDDLRHYGL